MTSRRLAEAALRCYPPATRSDRGAEMLDTLLEAAADRHGAFLRDVASLAIAGLSERAQASGRTSVGRTLADSAKLAAILYACLLLTAWLKPAMDPSGPLHHTGRASLYAVALILVLLAWSRGRQRLAGMIGVASVVSLVVVGRSGAAVPAAVTLPIVPSIGYLVMCFAPARTRTRPSPAGIAALIALAAVSVIVSGPYGAGASAFIVLAATSIAGLLVFAVQPRLAIAAGIIWTGIGVDQIAAGGASSPPFKLLIVAAPAVLAAAVVRAQMLRRAAT